MAGSERMTLQPKFAGGVSQVGRLWLLGYSVADIAGQTGLSEVESRRRVDEFRHAAQESTADPASWRGWAGALTDLIAESATERFLVSEGTRAVGYGRLAGLMVSLGIDVRGLRQTTVNLVSERFAGLLGQLVDRGKPPAELPDVVDGEWKMLPEPSADKALPEATARTDGVEALRQAMAEAGKDIDPEQVLAGLNDVGGTGDALKDAKAGEPSHYRHQGIADESRH